MTNQTRQELMFLGAQMRWNALHRELYELKKLFPALTPPKFAARTPKRTMSAASRRAISQRMKAYWQTKKLGGAKKPSMHRK